MYLDCLAHLFFFFFFFFFFFLNFSWTLAPAQKRGMNVRWGGGGGIAQFFARWGTPREKISGQQLFLLVTTQGLYLYPNALYFCSHSELKTNFQTEEEDFTHETHAAHNEEPGQNPSDESQIPEEENSEKNQRTPLRSRKSTTNTEDDKALKRPKNLENKEPGQNEGNVIIKHLSFEMNFMNKNIKRQEKLREIGLNTKPQKKNPVLWA